MKRQMLRHLSFHGFLFCSVRRFLLRTLYSDLADLFYEIHIITAILFIKRFHGVTELLFFVFRKFDFLTAAVQHALFCLLLPGGPEHSLVIGRPSQ